MMNKHKQNKRENIEQVQYSINNNCTNLQKKTNVCNNKTRADETNSVRVCLYTCCDFFILLSNTQEENEDETIL